MGIYARRMSFLHQVSIRPILRATLAVGLSACLFVDTAAGQPASDRTPDVRLFLQAASPDEKASRAAIAEIEGSWREGYAGMVVDVARFLRGRRGPAAGADAAPAEGSTGDEDDAGLGSVRRSFPPPSGSERPRDPPSASRARLTRLLERKTGQRFGDDLRAWRKWIWSRPYEPHPDLLFFKAALYSRVDPRMASFFPPGARSLIRLDEVDWGGVKPNGIPPLDHPKHVAAAEARWLKDKHIVFGVSLNGQARAYPKRILGWHELALDRLGGVELAVVYCTLCGTAIPYGAEVGGRKRTFGTSGLLYRSNKLMFDHESMSLWSTAEGRPVIGPLAGSDLELTAHPVVTTTWREWRATHPDTTVLALDTGFERDYSEGAAYREYFASDDLMFEVPGTDGRLKNKAEVLTLLLRPPGADRSGERRPLAIAAEFLKRNPLHHVSFAGHDIVVITSPDAGNRVYESAGVRFARVHSNGRVQDTQGRTWRLAEDALELDAGEARRPRVPARRAFWFGWYAQFPQTELIH
jgi:hypothetical protein